MTIEEKAREVARLILDKKFMEAKAKWCEHTDDMTSREMIEFRRSIERLERAIGDFEQRFDL